MKLFQKLSSKKSDKPKFVTKKSLGQNFLVDDRITNKIIDACQLTMEDTVLEIGPGQGVLTRLIAFRVKKVIAVETDRRLYEQLKKEFAGLNIEVVHADFLKYDLSQLPEKVKVIGNLPYYISTPIIIKILENHTRFKQLFITVQWEFGERLIAEIGTKDYCSLTCLTEFYSDAEILFKIHPQAFRPIPKVASCFMRFDLLDAPRADIDADLLFKVIRQAFTQRRKALTNALGAVIPKDKLQPILKSLKIDEKSRPENLSLENYIQIVKAL